MKFHKIIDFLIPLRVRKEARQLVDAETGGMPYFSLHLILSFLMPVFSALTYFIIGLFFYYLFIDQAGPAARALLGCLAFLLLLALGRLMIKSRQRLFIIARKRWWLLLLVFAPFLTPVPFFALAGILPFIIGWQQAALHKQPPSSAFQRMLPLVLPVLILLIINMLIIPGIKTPHMPLWPHKVEAFYSTSWDHVFLGFLLPTYAAYWLGFFLNLEGWRPAEGKFRALIFIILAPGLLYGGNLMTWHWSIKDIELYRNLPLKIYDATWSYNRDDYVSYQGATHFDIDFSPYRPRHELKFPREPWPTDRMNRPDWPYLHINWPLMPFHELAHVANQDFDYGTPDRYTRCDYMFAGGHGFWIGSLGATEAFRANTLAIIFEPGPEYLEEIIEFDLERTVIAREALVFIVHKDNPVSDLSLEKIAGIFSGQIKKWSEVGGTKDKIISFQRPKGAKSSQMLNSLVMGGLPMPAPRREFYWPGHDGLLEVGQAVYHNHPEAIGYALNWPARDQAAGENVKFISVGGVDPTLENIESGTYPLTVNIEVVSVKKPASESFMIKQWLTSPEGRDFIRRLGYAPAN